VAYFLSTLYVCVYNLIGCKSASGYTRLFTSEVDREQNAEQINTVQN